MLLPMRPRGIRLIWAPLAVALLIAVALVLTLTLGNPLGRATGLELFTERASAGRVIVESPRADERLAETARWAEGYLAAIAARFGHQPPGVTIRLLTNQAAYRDFGRKYLPGFSPRMDFCYDRNTGVVYGFFCPPEALQAKLRHELFHRLSHQSMPGLPLWLDEGIAELTEGMSADQAGALSVERIDHKRLRAAVKILGGDTELAALARCTPDEFYGDRGDRWYTLAYCVALHLEARGELASSLATGSAQVEPRALAAFVADPPERVAAAGAPALVSAMPATAVAAGMVVLPTVRANR